MSFTATLAGIFEGLGVTATITFYGMMFAVPFALVFGVLQHFTRGFAHLLVTSIIEFWRSSPVIILLFVFYYSLPSFGITLSGITVGAMALGLNIGGYGSQSVRAALQALDVGQVEAGKALGLRRIEILGLIELPQAFAAMVPTFINQFIQLIKGTALVSLITLTDMTFRAKEISQLQYDPVGTYTALLLAYFIVCYPATILGRWTERRVSIEGRGQRDV
ncbi:amino acid ABC transporter permease [Nitratireductor rhodophyticola]|uniref:amino acid ABC transporter permease n=1 Tax=Nitratireductor rhodophyticola TaxID=2854036 RepID=UPI00081417F7|nr:amino acid ABC transporter permease [Nitratireductor rhodophyticola]MEC9247171.1 amino acid ABC transporter permease [Pseudomonadota bacterium]WPZ14417.1 amino acid ABC transporter permease [Nitratireductor rhodophyticola]